jgi:hypothetical protein
MGRMDNGVDLEVMAPGLSLVVKDYPGFHPRREIKDGLTIDFGRPVRQPSVRAVRPCALGRPE